MRIAVNASSFTNRPKENNINSFSDYFFRLASSHLKHTFIFIFNKSYDPAFEFPENVIPVVIGPEDATPLKWRIWYNIKIPSVLKKYKADIFISENFCSVKNKTPQILISPDLTYIYQPSFVNKKHLNFYKKYTPRFLNTANEIIVYSMFLKNELIKKYKINDQKIQVIYHEVNKDFKPLNFEERELTKEKYADGNEYFIHKGIISTQQNLMNLLKAFSFFKKRQKSKMHLIITGNIGIQYEEFIESLRLYRFNKEVKVLTDLSDKETQKIVASAYAMVSVPLYEMSSVSSLESMRCDVPVIAASTGIFYEICGEAALYANPENIKDISEKMMLLFKDEKMRKDFIEKGRTQVNQFYNKGNPTLIEIIESEVTKDPIV
ncbi:MAG: glycosyltransferase family 1 protein [Ginsengibacter sp.]